MNNNRLTFFIGCSLCVVSMLLLLTGSRVDVAPYLIVSVALVFGGVLNDIAGE